MSETNLAPLVGLMFVTKDKLLWKNINYNAGSLIDSKGPSHYIVTFFNDDVPVLTDTISFCDINQTKWLFYDPKVSTKEGAQNHARKN